MDALAGLIVAVVYLWLIGLMICSTMGIFIKAGKPWWAAIVPIYNIIVVLEIVGKPIWWIILFFIPLVSLVAGILIALALAKSFGKEGGFVVGLILVPFVFMPMLAFGDAQYRGPAT